MNYYIRHHVSFPHIEGNMDIIKCTNGSWYGKNRQWLYNQAEEGEWQLLSRSNCDFYQLLIDEDYKNINKFILYSTALEKMLVKDVVDTIKNIGMDILT